MPDRSSRQDLPDDWNRGRRAARGQQYRGGSDGFNAPAGDDQCAAVPILVGIGAFIRTGIAEEMQYATAVGNSRQLRHGSAALQ